MAAAGAGSLTYACSGLQGFDKDFRHALIAMLYVLSMHILNNMLMIKSDKYNNPQRAFFYKNNRLYLWISALVSGVTGLYFSFAAGVPSFIILLIMSFLGLAYNLRIIPFIVRKGQFARIKDIPGSKTILITIAWGTVTCLLPAVANQSNLIPVAVVFIFAAGLVFARTAFFDILAIQGDRITGRETLPILIGEKQSFNIIQYILIFDVCIVLLAFFMDLLVNKAFILAFMPLIMFLLIKFFRNDTRFSGAHREFIIELTFLGAGLLSAVI
jgi:4-hydroxy-3-methylbut-2-enyl diphosphate reductase